MFLRVSAESIEIFNAVFLPPYTFALPLSTTKNPQK
jgi:hypothetical protein